MSSKPGAGDLNARTDGDAADDKKNDVRLESDGGTKRLADLPGFRRDMLIALAHSGPTHGRAIAENLETLRREHINDGRFYPNLNALVDDGLVEKRVNEHDERSHEYALSKRGRGTIREYGQRIAGAIEALDGGAR